MRTLLFASLLSCAVAALWAGAAQAKQSPEPQIDCSRIVRLVDRAICSDANAAKADAALNAAYTLDMHLLSPQGVHALRDSQRSFLRAIDEQCTQMPGAPDDIPSSKTVAACVARHYQGRADTLSHSVFTCGHHLFYTAITYRARIAPAGPQTGLDQAFAVIERDALVQIDSPAGPAEIAWNANARVEMTRAVATARSFGATLPGTTFNNDNFDDVYVTQALVSASRDMIVSTIQIATTSIRPEFASKRQTATLWSLRLGRALAASDIFSSDTAWPQVLAAAGRPEGVVSLAEFDPAPDPHRWQVLPDGLHIVFDQIDRPGYDSGAQIIVRWESLKPYLRKDLPFDPAKLEIVSGVQY